MKDNKGVTLVALVITIIVLLILAGVTLYLTIGENGVLRKAEKVEITFNKSEVLEALNIAITEKYLDAYSKATKDGKMNIKDHYDGDKVIYFLRGYESDENGNIMNSEENPPESTQKYIEPLNGDSTGTKFFVKLDTLKRTINKYGKGENGSSTDYFYVETSKDAENKVNKATLYYMNLDETPEEIGDLQIQQSI